MFLHRAESSDITSGTINREAPNSKILMRFTIKFTKKKLKPRPILFYSKKTINLIAKVTLDFDNNPIKLKFNLKKN